MPYGRRCPTEGVPYRGTTTVLGTQTLPHYTYTKFLIALFIMGNFESWMIFYSWGHRTKVTRSLLEIVLGLLQPIYPVHHLQRDLRILKMIPIPQNMGFDIKIKYLVWSLFSTKVTISLIVDFVLDLQIDLRRPLGVFGTLILTALNIQTNRHGNMKLRD